MKERLHRTQILLEPEQHRILVEMARQERRSLSDLVRQMIADQLARRQEAEQLNRDRHHATFEQIRQHRNDLLERRGGKPLEIDVSALIRDMREERDVKIVDNVENGRH